MNPIDQIEQKISEVKFFALRKLGVTIPDIKFEYNLRGHSSGQAGYTSVNGVRSYFVRFNKSHIQLGGETFQHLLNDTIPHELAHIICYEYPWFGKDHDEGWQKVCKALGGNGKQFYSGDDAPEATKKTWPIQYTCSLGNKVNVSKLIHKRIQQGKTYATNGGGIINFKCPYTENK